MNLEKSEANVSIAIKDLIVPLSILILVFLAVWAFAPSMDREGYIYLQTDAFIFLNDVLNNLLVINPYVWSNITYLGNTLVALLLVSWLIVVQSKVWAAIFGAIPLAGLLSGLGKLMAAMPRPAVILDHDSFTIIDRALIGHTSFPSGHTITVFCIITAIVLSFRGHKNYRQLFYGAFSLAFVLVISRVAVGAHWPLDIVVGAVLGYISGLSGVALVNAYQGWWVWMKNPKYKAILIVILLSFIWFLLSDEYSFNAFTGFNGIIWPASLMGLWTIIQLLKVQKK